MASPLSTSVINFFVPIFVFLLIFIATYALLQKTKLLGTNQGLQALAALVTGLIFMLYQPGRLLIMVGTPWLIFFGMILIGIIGFLLFFGVAEKDISTFMGGGFMLTIMISFVVILFLVVMTKAFGPFLMADNAPTFWGAVKRTLYSSKVLGAILLLVIAAYAVKWLPEAGK
ncbi:MAG: hypothetical protein Q7R56_03130 [Nanoarchaeota archaeon]|nr:hypothetical protein [Nanoarchaeota archaeon]